MASGANTRSQKGWGSIGQTTDDKAAVTKLASHLDWFPCIMFSNSFASTVVIMSVMYVKTDY
ncbi:hypothetical protein GCM10009114_03640 [Aliiglaciecola litoralis]|uniref:Uncharacterized protein n=1 Tax=Aliiglaciecola litoralis TaxID=582857 RepID=A0ABN1LD31_9ALTE